MPDAITLVGLDCGSTTTSLVVARARLTQGALGRVEIADVEDVYRSPIVFTPFSAGAGNRIDDQRLAAYLDEWLAAAGTRGDEIFGGGALVTGLAAESANARAIAELVEARLADAVIATANDPALESWLAFMGNCHGLSMARPATPIVNIDVGGGTTNLALGVDGQVIAVGALDVGARHLQFAPGTHRLTAVSPRGAELLDALGISCAIGEELATPDVERIVDFYVRLIESAVERREPDAMAQPWVLLAFDAPGDLLAGAVVTFSGGVGQLIYDARRGSPPPRTTEFGDLGGELAGRLSRSPLLARRSRGLEPEGLGRSTAYGLLRHRTELSGATLYLPDPARLPLKNVPIVARLSADASESELKHAVQLAVRCRPAGCLQIGVECQQLDELRTLGERLARALETSDGGGDQTLVVLVPGNLGKVLGNYATRWGRLARDLIVVDEVPMREAQFVRLGRMREGVVPLWLYAVR